MIPLKKRSIYKQELWELGFTGNTYRSHQTYGSRGNQSGMYDSCTQYGGSQADGEYDYYRDTNVSGYEQQQRAGSGPRSHNSMGFNGSVVGHGSEYGGAAIQNFMMTPPLPCGSQAISVYSLGPDYAAKSHTTPMTSNVSFMMGSQQDKANTMYDRSSGMKGNQSEYETRHRSQFSLSLSQGGMQLITPPGTLHKAHILTLTYY